MLRGAGLRTAYLSILQSLGWDFEWSVQTQCDSIRWQVNFYTRANTVVRTVGRGEISASILCL